MTVLAADKIRAARAAAGLTQDDVGFALRVRGHKANGRSVRRWESGENTPIAHVIPDLAEVLGVTMLDLYDRKDAHNA